MWPGRQRHFVSPSHIGVVPLTPWEGILVEFTAKWPGAKSLRKTRKRWSGVLVNGKIWEGEKWVPEHRKKALRVAGGEKGWGGAQTAPWTEAEAGHLCGGFPQAFLGGPYLLRESRPGWSILRQAADFLVCWGLAWFPRKSVIELPSPEGEQWLRLERNNIWGFSFSFFFNFYYYYYYCYFWFSFSKQPLMRLKLRRKTSMSFS